MVSNFNSCGNVMPVKLLYSLCHNIYEENDGRKYDTEPQQSTKRQDVNAQEIMFVCFITKSFLTYSFFPPTPALSTISRPLSSSIIIIIMIDR